MCVECGDYEEQVWRNICDVLPGDVKDGGVVSGGQAQKEALTGVRTRS